MGLSDGRRRQLARLQKRKTREREGLVLVEGLRGVEDALASNVSTRWALCSPRLRRTERGVALAAVLEGKGVELVWESDPVLEGVASTEAPQGVLLVVAQPASDLDALPDPGRVLLADGIQDPGNLGTLIRAGFAFDLDGVVVLDGSADPWSPKAVRSAAGACFRVPIAQARWPDVRSWLEGTRLQVLAATADGTDVAEAATDPRWALAVGSEARGVRPAVDEAAVVRVAVPMPGGAESLNAGVAGAILLYALTRNGPNA